MNQNYQAKIENYTYFDIVAWCRENQVELAELPFSIRLLLENNLRHFDGKYFTEEYIGRLGNWAKDYEAKEIPFLPGRILLQDLTGVPAVVDIAAMRQAMLEMGAAPEKINPQIPVDLVIDHSVSMDYAGQPGALEKNVALEFQRNAERYRFLKWAENNLSNFRVFEPGQGICHQVNLEKIATVVSQENELCYPDTVVGTDSHTTMINGLGVLGWGVGGIEAEAAMLGQPIYMLNPEVVGVKMSGRVSGSVTATDIVLHLTHLLRKVGVVGKFVEYFGEGADHLPVTDRATIANMAPEYGATMGYFPVDNKTLDYLRLTGRSEENVWLVEKYCQQNGLFRQKNSPVPKYTKVLEVDLSEIRPALAGPKRPQDLVLLPQLKENFMASYGVAEEEVAATIHNQQEPGQDFTLNHGTIVLAAITSCTNTSNPQVILGAGLLARKAVEAGLKVPAYVKTSFAPGSLAVTRYLEQAGLLSDLEKLGFGIAGYGCATCIGNSGPLAEEVSRQIQERNLQVAGILSGNRNFEGRIHPLIPANYLASPILVVAFALAGRMTIDLEKEPLGINQQGKSIYFRDICPSQEEMETLIRAVVKPEVFRGNQSAFRKEWNALSGEKSAVYQWEESSTYVRLPNYFDSLIKAYHLNKEETHPMTGDLLVEKAKVLAILGDSVTTDHISPAGSIAAASPAARYLHEHGIDRADFNSYGSRRGNHEVMARGTFANIRLKNQMADGKIGGYTKKEGQLLSIYEAAMAYQAENTPLIILAGKEYGTGSSRDWAAKGPLLLGVKAVVAESFERIHRSNLLGMGILPLQFMPGESAGYYHFSGEESFSIRLTEGWKAKAMVEVTALTSDGRELRFMTQSRLDNEVEIEYFLNGGILNTVLKEKCLY
ncbi:aconitate hydratase AcnA [Clostridiales bacterium COT073_COT-073]|nr:aconitate hydratase AcnA [Clostridiales bacterium COT073_COT-073]